MISDNMSSGTLHHQNVESKSPAHQGGALPTTLQSPDRTLPSRLGEKHNPVLRRNTEKSVLDDIMGDPDDFGDMGASDVESDGGRWEDTLRELEQCDTTVEESLQRKLLTSQASCDASHDPKQQRISEASLDQGLEHVSVGEQECLTAEAFACLEEASYAPTSITTHVASPHKTQSKRFFIIKSLNYHNIEKSMQKGIWATQAMNERILNEAFESADKVLLIFSVNMSGHFQGYAQMTSAIGRRKVNVWSEANWGGSFSVEWIRLYDLPFQKTLHLKNPLNSYKPVKISRDCQELTAEIGEVLCALLDEGAESEEHSKRRLQMRSDYFTKKPYMERQPPFDSAYFNASLRNQMHSAVYPAPLIPQMTGRPSYMKHAGSSSSTPSMHFQGARDLNHGQEDKDAVSVDASPEEDFLNMSYEEYLQFRNNSRVYKHQQQGSAASHMSQFGAGWTGKRDINVCADDAYAAYLASWYANQQTSMMHNGYYQSSPTITSSFQNVDQPP